MSNIEAVKKYLKHEITARKLMKLVPDRHDLIGCFANLYDERNQLLLTEREAHADSVSMLSVSLGMISAELSRCVRLLDGECTLPDGSNADTRHAHALLGHFQKEDEEQ